MDLFMRLMFDEKERKLLKEAFEVFPNLRETYHKAKRQCYTICIAVIAMFILIVASIILYPSF